MDIVNLSVRLPEGGDRQWAVQDLSLRIEKGEVLCLVGESGSGKSLTAMAIMDLLPKVLSAGVSGRIELAGSDILKRSRQQRRRSAGKDVAMIFQEPMTALNPVVNIGTQVEEVLKIHEPAMSGRERRDKVLAMLDAVKLPRPKDIYRSFPHELSGGQRQRAMIAMALILDPMLLIADEPTTALDVTTQAEILKLIKELQTRRGTGVLFITHDIGIVREIADTVVVLRNGTMVESGPAAEVLTRPAHDYTRTLISAIPEIGSVRAPARTHGPEVVRLDGLRKTFTLRGPLFSRNSFDALAGIDLALRKGEVLSIVGESGSGKSTLARCIAGLSEPTAGHVSISGQPPLRLHGPSLRAHFKRVQMVFQDPNRSLNPRRKIGASIIEGPVNYGMPIQLAKARAAELLELVGLRADAVDRFPYQFSGGQRQRICIARALAMDPELLIADEAVSALDATIQQQVLQLISDLRRRFDLSVLFITHDLRVAAQISDTIAVMQHGSVVEIGTTETVLGNPQSSYTKQLLSTIPGTGFARDSDVLS